MATMEIVDKATDSAYPDGGLNTKNAAFYIGVKEKTLSQWRWRGKKGPKFKKIGRKVFYYLPDLDDFINRWHAVWKD